MTMISKMLHFVSLLLVVSCGFLVQPSETYSIKNESLLNIKIEAYSRKNLIGIINIPKGEQFDTTFFKGGSDRVSTFSSEAFVDSVLIKFENQRFILQYCEGKDLFNTGQCRVDKNLANFYGGKITYGNNKKRLLLTFDQNDFEKALPL
jgi:hypothetical protein